MPIVIQIIIEENKTAALFRQFPQANKITFVNLAKDVRDSIAQVKIILEKLPRRLDNQSVSYALDKHRLRYYSFSFNWYTLDNLESLELNDNLHDFEVTNSLISWNEYVGKDVRPFDTLSLIEAKRFIGLIKYLDRNNLNAATLKDGAIAFDYNDSLRLATNLGFRIITLDTNGRYGSEYYHVFDTKDGFFLLTQK